MSATDRGSHTFENKKTDKVTAEPKVAFEQVLAKNRIRPMTSYTG